MFKTSISYKEILSLSIPIMVSSVAQSIAGVVDTAYMGRVGEAQMDATGFCALFLFIVSIVTWGFSKGIQILIANKDGAKEYRIVGNIFQLAFYIAIIYATCTSVILYFFHHEIISLLIKDARVVQYADVFIKTRIPGFFITNLIFIITSLFLGIGISRVMIYSVAIGALLNIGLNYVLVFGKYGFEAMGVKGSAISTNCSEWLTFLILVGYLLSRKEILKKYAIHFKHPFHTTLLQEIVQISAPLVVQFVVSLGAWLFFFSLIEKMGTTALAVSMIIKNMYSFIMIPVFSISSAANTIVGNLVGKKLFDDIKPAVYKISLINIVLAFSMAILCYVFFYPILSLFTTSETLIQQAYEPYMICLIGYLFFPLGNTFFQGILSLGNTKISMIIESTTIFIYLIYMYVVIHVVDKTSLALAWSTEGFYWILLLILCISYFHFVNWKKALIEKTNSTL